MMGEQLQRTTKVLTQGPVRTGRILLVSEDQEEMEYFMKTLAELDGDLVPCRSYVEALDRLGREKFNLIIVGQGTPAFEGCRVLERVRELHLSTPVVVTSRAADMGCYIRAMELGATDYLESGTMPRQLVGLLDVYLSMHRAA